MEFCRSGDLAQHLLTLKEGSESVDERRGMSWMFQLCEALAYLHQRKVVYQDHTLPNEFLHISRYLCNTYLTYILFVDSCMCVFVCVCMQGGTPRSEACQRVPTPHL